jgi:hypothetical protein
VAAHTKSKEVIKPVLKTRPFKELAQYGNSSPFARHYMGQSNKVPNLEDQLPKVPYKKMRRSHKTLRKSAEYVHEDSVPSQRDSMSNLHVHGK